jgi:hypothetical protein
MVVSQRFAAICRLLSPLSTVIRQEPAAPVARPAAPGLRTPFLGPIDLRNLDYCFFFCKDIKGTKDASGATSDSDSDSRKKELQGYQVNKGGYSRDSGHLTMPL